MIYNCFQIHYIHHQYPIQQSEVLLNGFLKFESMHFNDIGLFINRTLSDPEKYDVSVGLA